ncbi:GNAT family N-acetyltransferase [Paenibacillus sp. HJL G12]|uniref:GNAT family N-acetyltransferase n=1 Tax=Paenibacillus dendrobii TaxID=2691084 RepID=A0A7X3IDS8_9BACL|nr:GNAT family N-acetyltransferase [Paenibacillus dendrobii]MWV42040.1 GNAT family N-acetyltransferase [Paenibacillus dendrobii]
MLQTKPARDEDEVFLFELFALLRSNELGLTNWDPAMRQNFLQMQWSAQKHSYAMQFPLGNESIIWHHGQPAGRIIVQKDLNELRLIDISIHPDYQNLGIGKALIQELQTEASVSQLPLRLSVLKTNPALNLYIRLGFFSIGENEMYMFMESNNSCNMNQ